MNHYTELLSYLRQLIEANDLVNTVTKGVASELDLSKSNIFPLVHIVIDSGVMNDGNTVVFDVSLECLSKRATYPDVVDDKFWSQDNEVDNHNETLAILNDVWLRLKRDWEQNDITAIGEGTLTKLTGISGNILDGWSLDFQVELPNTTITLCGT